MKTCPHIFMSLLAIVFMFWFSEADDDIFERPRKLNPATLNTKTVGLILRANGKQYYVSSELCPGGIFLTHAVNENCLCYNGIFQLVRECCQPSHTRIHSDNLEWRMDFKCGTSPVPGNNSHFNPIRAIIPISKPHNRFGSAIMTRSLAGNNTAKWRKFDVEDIIIGNNGQVNMNGKTQFEIVNIKPLGREIRIMFGKFSDMMVCYSGWLTDQGHHNLRVSILTQGETKGCCFNITQMSSPGEVRANCSSGLLITEVIDVQSSNADIGQCNENILPDSYHLINKRNPDSIQGLDKLVSKIPSRTEDDILGDRGQMLFKRDTAKSNDLSEAPLSPLENNNFVTADGVILARRKGLSMASVSDQAHSINEFVAIIRNDLSAEIREPQTPRFRLLKKAFDIFLSVVPNEVIPNIMVQTAFDVFYFLYEELEPVIYEPPEMFNQTMRFLNMCYLKENMLEFSTTGCPRQIDELVIDSNVIAKLENYYKEQPEDLRRVLRGLKHVDIRKDKRFVPELHDIYVEINWKVTDFVHSLCFDYFEKEINAHTYFETEIEELFLFNVVQSRWFTKHGDLRYVAGIFPVSDLRLSMKQLDKVVAIGHHLSRYNGSYWLERPKPEGEFAADKLPIISYGAASEPNSEARLLFVQSLLEDEKVQALNQQKMGLFSRADRLESMVSSVERSAMYPFQYSAKLPAGELIWDGMAVCLHAAYSNSKSYFVDSEMWGVTPSLLELGQLYPS